MSLHRQASVSSSAFVPGDEVEWHLTGGDRGIGWILALEGTNSAYVFHADGSHVEMEFEHLSLQARYPPRVRPRVALMVQLAVKENVLPKPNLEDIDIPEVMANFIHGVRDQIPLSIESFREQCRRLKDLQSVYDKIDELHEQISELNTPDKNVIWLNAQRRELENTIDGLNNRVSDLKGNKRDLEDKVASLEAMNQKFVGSYKQFLEQKEKLVNISQTLDEQKKELEENLAEEKHNNNKLTGENGRHLQKIMSMENQNTDLLRELTDTKSLYKEEITKREELQMKVASCEKTNADLLSQLELLVSANRELQQGMREWRIQNQDIFAQLKNLSTRNVSATQNTAELVAAN